VSHDGELKHPLITLAIISVSYLILIVDGSIVITALPLIRENLGFSAATLSWVQSAYALSLGGLLLLGARVGDIIGRRRGFLVGLCVFMAASLMAGWSPNAVMLIVARVLQGVGASLIAPSTLALLSTNFPKDPARARAVAVYGSITGIGMSLGLVLGGFVTHVLSWRWAFWINVPIGLVLIVATRYYVKETERHTEPLDVAGAVWATLSMTGIVYGLVNASEYGWGRALTIAPLFVGVALLGLFLRTEQRASAPLVPLHLLANAERSGANTARFLFVGSMAGFWFFIAQYLEVSRGLNPFGAGLAFLPMTLGSFAIAFLVPRLSRRFGTAPFLIGGLATVSIGTFWMAGVSSNGSYLWTVALPMLVVGVGQGASTIRLTSAAIHGVSPKDAGAASGVVSAAVQIGNAFGLSLLVALTSLWVPRASTAALFAAAHARVAMVGGGVLCTLALTSAVVFVWHPHRRDER